MYLTEPLLTKTTTCSDSGHLSQSRSAKVHTFGWRYRVLVFKVAICRDTASTTLGWQWPTWQTLLRVSRYDRPVSSINFEPLPCIIISPPELAYEMLTHFIKCFILFCCTPSFVIPTLAVSVFIFDWKSVRFDFVVDGSSRPVETNRKEFVEFASFLQLRNWKVDTRLVKTNATTEVNSESMWFSILFVIAAL